MLKVQKISKNYGTKVRSFSLTFLLVWRKAKKLPREETLLAFIKERAGRIDQEVLAALVK